MKTWTLTCDMPDCEIYLDDLAWDWTLGRVVKDYGWRLVRTGGDYSLHICPECADATLATIRARCGEGKRP